MRDRRYLMVLVPTFVSQTLTGYIGLYGQDLSPSDPWRTANDILGLICFISLVVFAWQIDIKLLQAIKSKRQSPPVS